MIARDTERDYYMSAEESMDYGVVDRVVCHRDAVPVAAAEALETGGERE